MFDFNQVVGSIGESGHHLYSPHATQAMATITRHGHILSHGHKVGTIDHSGKIRDQRGHEIGHIDDEGHVRAKWSPKTGFFMAGHTIHDQQTGQTIAITHAGEALGGAAMLLMLNKD